MYSVGYFEDSKWVELYSFDSQEYAEAACSLITNVEWREV
jgi:hypothetical protein